MLNIIEIEDIIETNEIRTYWKGNEYYESELFNEYELNCLKLINAFKVIQIPDQNYQEDFNSVLNKIFDKLESLTSNRVIFYSLEHKLEKINKIRSHKGVFKNLIQNKQNLIEKEFLFADDDSLIASCVKNEIIDFVDYAYDNRQNFFLIGDVDLYYSENFLKKVVYSIRNNEVHTSINYFKFLIELDNCILIRIETNVNSMNNQFAVFFNKSQRNLILSALNTYDL